MSRACWVAGVFACGLVAQQKERAPAKQEPPPARQEQAPAEEDEALAPKEYTLNPLQAEKELRIGNYYFRKGSFRAAAQRFREATKWNGQLAEAYLRLGEAEEKQKDVKAAREAYQKYLELAPEAKNRAEVTKKIAHLGGGKS
jgi:tetratricopeptide (TPR) repeat protein